MRKIGLSLLPLVFYLVTADAQPVEEDLPQITGCIALINARVVTAPGKNPVIQTIILRDGLITQMGPSQAIPADAYRIAADSFFVYPAFIDACSYLGIKEPENEGGRGGGGGSPGSNPGNREKPAIDEEGNASLEETGITPFRHVRATFDPKDKSIADWRAVGFAVSHVVPRGRMIPGQGAIVVLSGKSADRMLWKEGVSLFGQWSGAGNVYPGTVIGVMAKWRELYHNAAQEVQHASSYSTATMVPRPQYNQAHHALAPLVKKEIPLFFKASKVRDISRAMEMQKDLGMKMVLADVEEAFMLTSQIRAGAYPLVLSLKLPEDKSATRSKGPEGREGPGKKEAEEKKEEKKQEVKSDSTKLDPEKVAFEKRRSESLAAHVAQAGQLARENIPFSFGTLSGKPGDFYKNLQRMIENGLREETALAALTTQPAQLLGIEKYCGTIQPGKMANLIVTTKPVFEKEANIRYMIVEGNLYAYAIEEKKKPTPKDKPVTPGSVEGTWTYSIDMNGEVHQGTFTFSGHGDRIEGSIKSDEITSGNHELESIVLDGSHLTFSYDFDADGQMITIEFDLTIADDSLEGTVSIPEFGTFQVKGARSISPH